MTASVNASGSQTCTVTTEHTIVSANTTANTYQMMFDFTNAVNGDEFEIRYKSKCRSADSEVQEQVWTIANAQTNICHRFPPILMPTQFSVSIKQTLGTSRAIPWALYAA